MITKLKDRPKPGDIKKKVCFAWLPTVINNHLIWLDYYTIVQEYMPWKKGTTYMPDGRPVMPCAPTMYSSDGWKDKEIYLYKD